VKRCAHRNRPLTSHVPRAEARPSAPRELSRPAASTHPRRMSPSHSKNISNPPSLFLPARGRGETGGGGVRGARGEGRGGEGEERAQVCQLCAASAGGVPSPSVTLAGHCGAGKKCRVRTANARCIAGKRAEETSGAARATRSCTATKENARLGAITCRRRHRQDIRPYYAVSNLMLD